MKRHSHLQRIAMGVAALFVASGITGSVHAQQAGAIPQGFTASSGVLSITGDERAPVIDVGCQPGTVTVEVPAYTTGVEFTVSNCQCADSLEKLKAVMLDVMWNTRDASAAESAGPETRDVSLSVGKVALEPGESVERKLYCYDITKLRRQ